MADDPRVVEGVRLFNTRQWFECHEVLEAVWHDDRSPGRTFWQGLIMGAVALEHWRRGNPRGASSQWRQGRAFLAAYPDDHLGFDVAGFLAAMDRALAAVASRAPEAWRGVDAVPAFDEAVAPRLRRAGVEAPRNGS